MEYKFLFYVEYIYEDAAVKLPFISECEFESSRRGRVFLTWFAMAGDLLEKFARLACYIGKFAAL